MSTLVLLQAGSAVPFSLDAAETVIGRHRSCSIHTDQDGVSRRHACVTRETEGFYLEDLGSSNGTFINGQRLTEPVLLKNGDRIRIGPMLLRFDHAEGAENPPPVRKEATESTSNTDSAEQTVTHPLMNVYSNVSAAREAMEAAKRAAEERRRKP